MPTFETFALFVPAALLVAVSPGPGILYVAARTLAGGRAEGLASSLGTGIGGLVHVLAGAVGISTLVTASAEAFTVLKIAGALYLIWLGVRTWRGARAMAPVSVGATGARQAVRGASHRGAKSEDGCVLSCLPPAIRRSGRERCPAVQHPRHRLGRPKYRGRCRRDLLGGEGKRRICEAANSCRPDETGIGLSDVRIGRGFATGASHGLKSPLQLTSKRRVVELAMPCRRVVEASAPVEPHPNISALRNLMAAFEP